MLSNATNGPYQYGRLLSTSLCPNGSGAFIAGSGLQWTSCNLAVDDEDNGDQLADPTFTLNQDVDNTIQSLNLGYEHDELGNVVRYVYYFIQDVSAGTCTVEEEDAYAQLDFKAHTYAMTSQCTPITQQCLPDSTWPYINMRDEDTPSPYFNCTPGFQGNFSFPGAAQTVDADPDDVVGNVGGSDITSESSNLATIGMSFAPDAGLSRRIGAYNPSLAGLNISSVPSLRGSNLSYQYLQPQNPLYFGVWGSGYPVYNAFIKETNPLLNDSQIYQSNDTGNTYWVLNCSATVLEFNYTWVNGSINNISHQLASPEIAALFSAPFAVDGLRDARQQLMISAVKASAADDMDSLASWFARYWAQAALALSIGVIQRDNTIVEQARWVKESVTRVPMLPLYLLLALKALYVVAVIALATGAYCFTHPAETELIKEQLSAKGLAAAHFDDPEILQRNTTRQLKEDLMPIQMTSPSSVEKTAGTTSEKDKAENIKAVERTVTGLNEMTEKRVGLVARADGAWRFAVVANGMWNGIKPIAVDLVGIEAKRGRLGEAGDLINAWK